MPGPSIFSSPVYLVRIHASLNKELLSSLWRKFTLLRATGDALLGAQHTEALARAYGGSRVIADVEGTHSSPRNRRALDYCGAFLREHLHLGAAPPAGRVDRVPWDVTL